MGVIDDDHAVASLIGSGDGGFFDGPYLGDFDKALRWLDEEDVRVLPIADAPARGAVSTIGPEGIGRASFAIQYGGQSVGGGEFSHARGPVNK